MSTNPPASSSALVADARGQQMQGNRQSPVQHGQLVPADQTGVLDMLTKVTAQHAFELATVQSRMDDIKMDVDEERQRADLSRDQLAQDLGNISDRARALEMQVPKGQQANWLSELESLELSIEHDVRKLERELPYAFLDPWMLIDFKRQRINVLRGLAQKGGDAVKVLRATHTKEQCDQRFQELCRSYNKYREEITFDGAAAKRELQLITEDPFYLPNLPPKYDTEWMDRDEWFAVLQKFLDFMQARFIPKGDWPASYDSWEYGVKPILKPAYEYYKTHETEILLLAGVTLEDSKKFMKELVSKDNASFASDYNNPAESLGSTLAPYRPFYAGFVKALFIERQVEEEFGPIGIADTNVEVVDATPPPPEYSADSILTRVRNGLDVTFAQEYYLGARVAGASIFRLGDVRAAHQLPESASAGSRDGGISLEGDHGGFGPGEPTIHDAIESSSRLKEPLSDPTGRAHLKRGGKAKP